MSFFKKLGHGLSHIAKKTGSGISHTFKKAGKNIVRGLGQLGGGALGVMGGEALATAIAPELMIPAMAVGGIIGKESGKEGAGLLYSSLEHKRKPKTAPVPSIGKAVQQVPIPQPPRIQPQPVIRKPIPDSKYFQDRPRLGQDGHGQRQQLNPIEKSRVMKEKRDMFL